MHFCHHSHCLVNVHYRFLRNLERELSKSPSNSPSNVRFRLYSKYIEKVYGTLSKHDRRPISLCVTELVRSLCPDKRGRYNGFRYSDGTTINQLEECQLKEAEEVFHIQVVLSDVDVERFVERSPLAVAWETRNANEQPHKKKLDICFNSLVLFLQTMHYCYDNFSTIEWIVTNKIPFQRCKDDAKLSTESTTHFGVVKTENESV